MQQIGETREAMTASLMKRIEKIINDVKHEVYYILVHAKPFPNQLNLIKQKLIVTLQRPPEMLACMLFKVDNKKGQLSLEWALPGDWPTFEVARKEIVPEVIASYNKLEEGLKFRMHTLKEEVKASTA